MSSNRPAGTTDRHLEYLDGLRQSGEVNMLGAGDYLVLRFQLDRRKARAILRYWIETFNSRQGATR